MFEELNHPLGLSTLLKGPDQIVFSTAKSLGLEVEVKPMCSGRDFEYVGKKFGVSEEQLEVMLIGRNILTIVIMLPVSGGVSRSIALHNRYQVSSQLAMATSQVLMSATSKLPF